MADKSSRSPAQAAALLDELGHLRVHARRDRAATVVPLVVFAVVEAVYAVEVLFGPLPVASPSDEAWEPNWWDPIIVAAQPALLLALLGLAAWFAWRHRRLGMGHGPASPVKLLVAAILLSAVVPIGVGVGAVFLSADIYSLFVLIAFGVWQRDWFLTAWAALGATVLLIDSISAFSYQLPDVVGWSEADAWMRGPGLVLLAVAVLLLIGALVAALRGRRQS